VVPWGIALLKNVLIFETSPKGVADAFENDPPLEISKGTVY
jgi:hypothetical protein